MNVFSVFTLFGGLAFFLYGMNIMSNGMEKMTGGRLEKMLKKLTASPIRSLAFGVGITIAIQSSSAVTVMLVGFVNSGLMELSQTIGIIMGSNIGTTFTAWILSLSGINSDNFFVRLLDPMVFSPVVAIIGMILIIGTKRAKYKDFGNIMLGFALLMFSMGIMTGAVLPLEHTPIFQDLLSALSSPLAGLIIGIVFTGIIQNSAASVGILQVLTLTGSITFGMAVPVVMGQNIGTCITALISSIGVGKNAKRVAMLHIYFNTIGMIVGLSIFYLIKGIWNLPIFSDSISPIGVAAVHTMFNILTTFILLPFAKQLEWLSRITIKEQAVQPRQANSFLDDRLLGTPSVALSECGNRSIVMSGLVKHTLDQAFNSIRDYSAKDADEVDKNVITIKQNQMYLEVFLVKLASKELSDKDSMEISKILHLINDFERLGNYALNLTEVGRDLYRKEMHFSAVAKKEVEIITKAVEEAVNITIRAYVNSDVNMARKVKPLEEVIAALEIEIRKHHISRLVEGTCTVEQGFLFNHLLTNYERIAYHCSNIADYIIQAGEIGLSQVDYLVRIQERSTDNYTRDFKHYADKYELGAAAVDTADTTPSAITAPLI